MEQYGQSSYSSRIMDMLKKSLDAKDKQLIFDPTAIKFVELFNIHYSMLVEITKLEALGQGDGIYNEVCLIKKGLQNNVESLIRIISEITGCKIIIHLTDKNDTIWKLSKKYYSNILEIYELNSLRNIFSLEKGKPILVPVKLI